ncbi:hypothetical protein [Clostridium pasteurianum]|uniref:Uncharacterized protein n=1 Tax=Clostridium pasteurianum BC1 TaxID=86416 RepID=R4K5T9_CLOPA|nr:hypothetical protein [Clostridium pasteurianum]AGK95909.1 hypothetical protein Clopa_0892 [Clostridium pasteurianum BC1]
MKLRKKLIGLLVAASLIVGTSVTAFAAPNSVVGTKVNNASKTVTAFVTKGSDVITTLTHADFQAYVHFAATYLAHNKSLSADSLQTVINDIKDVHSKYPSVTSVADYKSLSEADKTVIRNDVSDAAAAVGLTVTRSADGSYVVTDSSTGSVIDTITK